MLEFGKGNCSTQAPYIRLIHPLPNNNVPYKFVVYISQLTFTTLFMVFSITCIRMPLLYHEPYARLLIWPTIWSYVQPHDTWCQCVNFFLSISVFNNIMRFMSMLHNSQNLILCCIGKESPNHEHREMYCFYVVCDFLEVMVNVQKGTLRFRKQ